MDLIDEIEQHRHVLLGEAELILEIADQRRPREVGLRVALRFPVRRLDKALLHPHPEPRDGQALDSGDDVPLAQHQACSFSLRRGS
jgi:hypothetical protein